MLVLKRMAGESIHVGSAEDTCVVTVLKVRPDPPTVAILINRASASAPGVLESRTLEMGVDAAVQLNDTSAVTLVDVREDKARIGIDAPKESSVHRLEVYEAIRRENGPDDGPAGSRVPRPPSPKPPSLDVRLDEPPTMDSGGE